MTKTIEEAANKAIIDNKFFMADPNHPEFVDRGLEQMRACKWIIHHIFSLPLSQRLTDEERERVKRAYKKAYSESFEPTSCLDRQYARGRYQVLREIFGKELFGEGEG